MINSAGKIVDRRRRNLFIVIYILSMFSVILSPLIGKVLVLVATGLFAFTMFALPKTYSYCLLFGLFPFANIFKLSPGSMSFQTVCEILLLIGLLIDRIIKRKSIRCNVILLLALIFTTMHMVIFSTNIDYLNIIKFVVRVIIVSYCLRSGIFSEGGISSIKTMAYCFSFSMLIMMMLSQNVGYMNVVDSYLRIVQYAPNTGLNRNGGLLNDPNYCSLAIMMSVTFITILYYYKKVKIEYWLLVVPVILLGFTTYSKSYFLMVAAFILLLLFLVLFPKHKGWAIILSIVTVFAVSSILSGQIEVINRTLDRFNNGDLFTGRDMLNEMYLEYVFSNPKVLFLGEGFDAVILPNLSNAVHNLYIELLFRMGIMGALCYIITVFGCFPPKKYPTKLVNYIPVIFMLVMYMALPGVASYELFYYILLSGIAIFQINNYIDNEEILSV